MVAPRAVTVPVGTCNARVGLGHRQAYGGIPGARRHGRGGREVWEGHTCSRRGNTGSPCGWKIGRS